MASIADLLIKHLTRSAFAFLCLSAVAQSSVIAGDETIPAQRPSSGHGLYAKVGEREITLDQFEQTYNREVRQRFCR